MELLLAAALFLFLTAAITAYGYRWYARPARALQQIDTAANLGTSTHSGIGAMGHSFQITTILQWMGEKVPESSADASITRRLLGRAGYRSDSALAIYAGIRVIAFLGVLAIAFLILQQARFTFPIKLIGAVAAGFAGFMGPSIVLDELVRARKERIRFSLPDALDLLVVCVESGLGLDQAIGVVSSELEITHPDISRELSLVNVEMRAGENRATALRNLAERTGENEIRKLTALLIQTDRFGTSLAQSLRTHASFMRVRRRHEAEERAGKLGVKLTIPIFFFILPSIMVIAAGPAIQKLVQEVLPALKNSGMNH